MLLQCRTTLKELAAIPLFFSRACLCYVACNCSWRCGSRHCSHLLPFGHTVCTHGLNDIHCIIGYMLTFQLTECCCRLFFFHNCKWSYLPFALKCRICSPILSVHGACILVELSTKAFPSSLPGSCSLCIMCIVSRVLNFHVEMECVILTDTIYQNDQTVCVISLHSYVAILLNVLAVDKFDMLNDAIVSASSCFLWKVLH